LREPQASRAFCSVSLAIAKAGNSTKMLDALQQTYMMP
jgi:hypothetical protein